MKGKMAGQNDWESIRPAVVVQDKDMAAGRVDVEALKPGWY
jgi:hypothetical protein